MLRSQVKFSQQTYYLGKKDESSQNKYKVVHRMRSCKHLRTHSREPHQIGADDAKRLIQQKAWTPCTSCWQTN